MFVHGRQAGENDLAVDELGTKEGRDKVPVLFPECAELGDAQVFLVEAPPGVLRFPVRRCRVGVLDSDKPVAPAHWQGRRAPAGCVASVGSPENGLALAFGEQATHRRNLAHLDGVSVEAREDAVQAEHVTVIHQQVPAVEIAAVV
jgi:hypothetical protein